MHHRPAVRPLLLALLTAGCQEYTVDKPEPVIPEPLPECEYTPPPTESRPINPLCDEVEPPAGGFTPVIKWSGGRNQSCTALPAVGDIDGDGMPEVIGNFVSGFLGIGLPGQSGDLVVLHGDTGREMWRKNADIGYGSAIALGNISGDPLPEILIVTAVKSGFVGFNGRYAVRAYDHEGTMLWQSEDFGNADFDYATAPVISDMNHDGTPEIVAGRVILNADGTTRGVGNGGHGSWGKLPGGISEGSIPAVVDIDLDGDEEVITGNTWYDIDGNTIWDDGGGGVLSNGRKGDGMVGIANLDDDPEGEVVISSYDSVRAIDTDGRLLWGPVTPAGANIVSPSAIADIDLDGRPEIIVAGGNQLIALNHDGTELWNVPVTDESGATGASIFDFEGDGVPEVVYIDEIQMMAMDGRTGAIKFYTDQHQSATMMDYPVVADVDADDHADIVVCHQGYGVALSVFEDEDNSWRPARRMWNQHAYSVTNIADDFSIPPSVPAPFTVHNTWHSAISEPVTATGAIFEGPVDVGAQILGFCAESCNGAPSVELFARLVNTSANNVDAGVISLSLYAYQDGSRILVDTEVTSADVGPGSTGGDVTFLVPRALAGNAQSWEVVADDIGGGIGIISECAEANNTATLSDPLCAAAQD